VCEMGVRCGCVSAARTSHSHVLTPCEQISGFVCETAWELSVDPEQAVAISWTLSWKWHLTWMVNWEAMGHGKHSAIDKCPYNAIFVPQIHSSLQRCVMTEYVK